MAVDTVKVVLFVGQAFQSALDLLTQVLDATGTRLLYYVGVFLFFAVVFLIGPLVPRENLATGPDRSAGKKSSGGSRKGGE